MPHYKQTSGNPDLPAIEQAVLAQWEKGDTFQKSVDARQSSDWVFYDGPPFANGLPHYGHLLTSCVKDLFARYQTQKGNRVERRFGWDCHGLPAEMGAEKELEISGRAAIEAFGIDKFNDHCRSSVMTYTQEWQDYVTRAARWVDFEHDYKTMDTDYMESVLWAFKQLYDKGLVYESHRVMPYSWAAQTPLSNFETRMDDAYRERTDKAVTVAFELEDAPKGAPQAEKYYLLAWTTTPWTLPSNLALAVKSDMSYSARPSGDACYIFANTEANHSDSSGIPKPNPGQDLGTILDGEKLIGLSYKPLFPYFADTPDAFKVIEGDFIEEGSGTGIVHIAPGFGEDDQRVAADAGIDAIICPVDEAGRFTDAVSHPDAPELAGLNVLEATEKSDDERFNEKQLAKFGLANMRIVKWLKDNGHLINEEEYTHSYPHCWRTDKPLIYKAVPSWYVEVTKFRDRMVELNQNINWIPHHIRDGQFGKWLEGARDWSISRNRFWGTPIPVWRGSKGSIKVFGAIAELEEFFETKVEDLHRPYIDELTIEKDGEVWTRVSDVFDCWFESGSMPFAQQHYPFENKDTFEQSFPADFIVEYVGQTRGWFYTLMVLSTALFDREPFKNCICHGIILDAEGKKLSKKLRNYPDPHEMFDTYGADAMRWRMISEPIMTGGNLLFSKDGSDIRDVVRLTIKPIWNAYHFFTLYANSDGMKGYNLLEIAAAEDEDSATGGTCCGGSHAPGEHPIAAHVMDRYILAKLRGAVEAVDASLSAFDTPAACSAVEGFFEVLNNWYIRRSRERFWRKAQAHDSDKQAAYDTLYTVLVTICQAAAPLLPLLSEEIYQSLTSGDSVHLTDYPDVSIIAPEAQLVADMDRVRDVCNAGLAIRNEENIRIRQPLATATVYGDAMLDEQYAAIIADELNIKQVAFRDEGVDGVARKELKLNFPVLGKRLGPKMKAIGAAAKQGDWQVDGNGFIVAGEAISTDEASLALIPSDPKGAQALASNDGLVVLDLEVTPELEAEGIARDVVRAVQQARKDADLNISDRIALTLDAPDAVQAAVQKHVDYVKEQTLAASLEFGTQDNASFSTTAPIDDGEIGIGISVAGDRAPK